MQKELQQFLSSSVQFLGALEKAYNINAQMCISNFPSSAFKTVPMQVFWTMTFPVLSRRVVEAKKVPEHIDRRAK